MTCHRACKVVRSLAPHDAHVNVKDVSQSAFFELLMLFLQEIKAVDRLFPALDQVQMQLACRHVLNAASSSGSNGTTQPAVLQMPAAQSAAPSTIDELSPDGQPADTLQNGGSLQESQPAWLQNADDLDSWILENLNDGPRRLRMVKILTQMAAPFRYGASKVLQALGDLNSENVS